MSALHVVHLINCLASIGGAERLILDLASHMPRKPTIVIAWHGSDNSLIEQDAEGVIDLIALRPLRLAAVRRAITALRRADVVHVHLFPSLYLGSLLTLPTVYTEHNTWNRRRDIPWLRSLERCIYRRYRKIVAISEETGTSLREWLREPPAALEVIPNGINLARFSTTPRPAPLAPYVLGMAARFAPEKDQATLLEAVSLLPENYSLLLAGTGKLHSRCERLAQEIGIAHRVSFKGQVSDMQKFFDSIQLYVQSSNADGFSIVTVEAMASGLPTLVSDIDGLRNTVGHPELLFPHRQPRLLAEQIRSIVEDGTRYDRLAQYAVQRALQFDVKETARRYQRAYEAVTGA